MAVLFSGPLLGVSAAVIVPFVRDKVNDSVATMFGATVGAVVFTAFVVAFVLSIRAYRKGDRSWVVWFALLVSCLVAGFWVFMLIGEFVFPH